MAATVLVTGVSRYLGGRFAQTLADHPDIERVIGVDVVSPSYDLGKAEFVRADIRNPVVARIMNQAEVDTVVHLAVSLSPSAGGARVSQKEINVMGTMQLLAACQTAPSVKRLIIKSTGAVYGSSPTDPAQFTEDMGLRRTPGSGYVKDSIEVEGYVRGVNRRRPDIDVVVLRMTHIVGRNEETTLTDYFRRRVIFTPFGYDARLQLLHEDDAVEALKLAVVGPPAGICNIAADGVLTLNQAARLVHRPLLPWLPARGRFIGARQRARLTEVSGEQFDYLLWGRCLDNTKMREVLGLEPRYTTREAFEDFARSVDVPLPGTSLVESLVDGAFGMVLSHLRDGTEQPRDRADAIPLDSVGSYQGEAYPEVVASRTNGSRRTDPVSGLAAEAALADDSGYADPDDRDAEGISVEVEGFDAAAGDVVSADVGLARGDIEDVYPGHDETDDATGVTPR